MPYADGSQQRLPYQSGSDTSHAGAVAARAHAAGQREQMAREYRRAGDYGVTDHEMADRTGIQISSINARRNELGAVNVGKRLGPRGVRVTAWALAQEHRT